MKSSADREACGDQRKTRDHGERSAVWRSTRGTGYIEGLDPDGDLQQLSCAVAGLSTWWPSLRFRKGSGWVH